MSNETEVPDGGATEALLVELRERADVLERQLAELQRQAEGRVLRSELKVEAVRAGMIDLDGLRLIDLPTLKLNESGEVEGAAKVMHELKKSKPWLFGGSAGASSSSTSAAPHVLPSRQKLATEMTDAEYRVARAAIVKKRT
jgi:hypothetical protein